MAFITDTFTEASDVDLSSHTGEGGVTWTDHPHVNYVGSFTVDAATDRIWGNDTAGYFASIVPSSPDYAVEADFYLHSAISQNVAVCARMDITDDTMYYGRLNNGTSWQLFRRVAGTSLQLGSDSTNQLPTAGNFKTGRLVVQGDKVSFYVNDTLEIGPITDSSITAAGRAGVRNAGAATATTGIHLDNLSVSLLNASAALFRGRNFPFFDDEEVNRFEFWPASSAGAPVHERSAAINATADIASAGTFFSVFERSTAISATALIATTGLHIAERSVAFDASAAISTSAESFSISERSAAVDASASVSVSGARVVERSASLIATASVESSGIGFTLFESAVSLSATASVESSAISFSVFERAVSASASALVEVAGVRIVERASSFSTTAAIETSGESFTIFERQLSLTAIATITTSRQVELMRSVAISTTADIAVSGGIEGGVFEHERSVAIAATGAIESAAISFSIIERAGAISASGSVIVSGLTVRERSASILATAAITTTAQRDLQRSVSISTAGEIQSSGVVGAEPIERAVAISATATISVSATLQHPTPPRRTFAVESSLRTLIIPSDGRGHRTAERERRVVV